jgi:uncharacterized protein (DUF58 family)
MATARSDAAARGSRGVLATAKLAAADLPELLMEARRVSATIIAGWHGRRVAGRGETFWQFRSFTSGDAANSVDWRRSARDDQLYVREKEWESPHLVWLWVDRSGSMEFRSPLATVSKRHRATVLLLALTDLLAAAGERVGLLGDSEPIIARNAAERMAGYLARHATGTAEPDTRLLRRSTDVVLIGDFLDPITEIESWLASIAQTGARAHLIQVFDPTEETFPHVGRVELHEPETGTRLVLGRAELYRDEYVARIAARRDRLARICSRLDWSFLIHRTDRPATEPLLTLHTRLSDRQGAAAGPDNGGRLP